MSERKNIERLFQEKFKDFEANPSEEIWSNIEAKLDEKKRRRIIPFWWKLSGVAALFIIGFLLTKAVYNNNISTSKETVTESNRSEPKINSTNSDTREKSNEVKAPKNSSNDAIVTNSKFKKSTETSNSVVNSSKDAVVSETANEKQSVNKNSNFKKNKNAIKRTFEKEENQIASNSNETFVSTTNLTKTEKEKNSSENTNSTTTKEINLTDLKGSADSNSKIATTKVENKINDTINKKESIANNVLEELLNEKESKVKQESKGNRWQLTSNVAPIFLGSISNGSPIDPELKNNSKSYNTTVGFGLGVSYAVNSKLKIRTGLNKFNLGYNTNEIDYYVGMQSRTLRNVTPTAASAMIQVESTASVNNPSTSLSESELLPFENNFVTKNKGYINQEIGYLEMPLEMSYSVLDKKFGFKIIGGFSTLLLQDNSITLVSDNRTTLLGEANNLNTLHFSTNLGLGLKYGFTKSFEFNVEPTVKYQLNTFSSNAGGFKPYLFGIYSGVSYKF